MHRPGGVQHGRGCCLTQPVSYFVEQLDTVNVDTYRYKVIFKPESIVPDVDLSTSR